MEDKRTSEPSGLLMSFLAIRRMIGMQGSRRLIADNRKIGSEGCQRVQLTAIMKEYLLIHLEA